MTNLEKFIGELTTSIDRYGKESVSPDDLLDLAEAIQNDLEESEKTDE